MKIIKFQSVLDVPRHTLETKIWDVSKDPPVLKEEVKNEILKRLKDYINDILAMSMTSVVDKVYLVGGICTYQWRPDSDIDVTVVMNSNIIDEVDLQLLREYVGDLNGENYDTTLHPINYYFRFDLKPISHDAIYDVLEEKWIKLPPTLPLPYDPEIRFSNVWQKAREWAENVDDILGELRRDIVDYDYIENFLREVPNDAYGWLEDKLQRKLQEIEADIRDAVFEYLKLHSERKHSYEQFEQMPIKDVISLSWLPADIKYKFAERYKYTELLSALRRILRENEKEGESLSEEDIPKIKEKMREFYVGKTSAKKLKVAVVDVDGVLIDESERRMYAVMEAGRPDLIGVDRPVEVMSEDEEKRFWEFYLDPDNIRKYDKINTRFVGFLKSLISDYSLDGIILLTGRNDSLYDVTNYQASLLEKDYGLPVISVITQEYGGYTKTPEYKSNVIGLLKDKYDVVAFIDDFEENIEEIARNHPDIPTIWIKK